MQEREEFVIESSRFQVVKWSMTNGKWQIRCVPLQVWL